METKLVDISVYFTCVCFCFVCVWACVWLFVCLRGCMCSDWVCSEMHFELMEADSCLTIYRVTWWWVRRPRQECETLGWFSPGHVLGEGLYFYQSVNRSVHICFDLFPWGLPSVLYSYLFFFLYIYIYIKIYIYIRKSDNQRGITFCKPDYSMVHWRVFNCTDERLLLTWSSLNICLCLFYLCSLITLPHLILMIKHGEW